MEADFLNLMRQTCKIEKWDGQDAYGQAAYGPAMDVRCRTAHKTRMVRNSNGEEVLSSATTWLVPSQITVKDRITLSDGSQPLILQVSSLPDESGIHHQVIYT